MTELSPAHEARLEAFKEYEQRNKWLDAQRDYEKLLGELAAAQATIQAVTAVIERWAVPCPGDCEHANCPLSKAVRHALGS